MTAPEVRGAVFAGSRQIITDIAVQVSSWTRVVLQSHTKDLTLSNEIPLLISINVFKALTAVAILTMILKEPVGGMKCEYLSSLLTELKLLLNAKNV